MKNLFLLLFIPLFFFSCIEVEKEVERELEVVIVEFGDLTSLSDDKQYGNFENFQSAKKYDFFFQVRDT